MKKIFLLLSIMISVCAMRAETFTISSTQHLADLISEDQKTTLTEVAVTTEDNTLLTAADMAFLAEMTVLETLDLRGVGYERANNCAGFNNNQCIKEIWWPNNVSFVAETKNTNIEKMHLPGNTNYNLSGINRLFNNTKLVAIDFYGEVTGAYESVDGVIYGWGNTLCYYPSGKVPENGNVIIPEGVTGILTIGSIGYNPNITAITLPSTFDVPDNMRKLTEQNTNLKHIYVAEGNAKMMTLFNDGCLYNVAAKSIIWTSPVIKFDEFLVIDGSLIESVPMGFLNGHSEVKHLKFTEGYKTFIGGALKNANGVETLELPASLEKIEGEGMHTMPNLKYVINHASVDPLGEDNEFFQVPLHERSGVQYIGWTTFYGQPSDVTIVVPEGSKDLYINSGWNRNWTHPAYDYENRSNGYAEDQFVEPTPLAITNGTTFHDAAAAGMVVTIKAKNPYIQEEGELNALADEEIDPSKMKFVGWIDLDAEKEGIEPVEFADPESEETTFVMPDRPVNIIAGYSNEDGTITAIERVEAATDAAPVYYNLQGQKVENPSAGLYIVRRGNQVSKEYVR